MQLSSPLTNAILNFEDPIATALNNSFENYYFFRITVVAMVEWLHCSTRIHKVLCSNLSISIHGMTLDKSPTAQLSRMTHSYHTEYIISQYVGRKGVQIPPSVKRKRQ